MNSLNNTIRELLKCIPENEATFIDILHSIEDFNDKDDGICGWNQLKNIIDYHKTKTLLSQDWELKVYSIFYNEYQLHLHRSQETNDAKYIKDVLDRTIERIKKSNLDYDNVVRMFAMELLTWAGTDSYVKQSASEVLPIDDIEKNNSDFITIENVVDLLVQKVQTLEKQAKG